MPSPPQEASAALAQRLATIVPPHVAALLTQAALLAAEHGWACYLVGGYVRDALLGWPDYDIDVSVVGDAVELAGLLAARAGVPLHIHDRFGTATLRLEEGLHLDIVTARHESYPQPGALPIVTAGTIDDDLARRDFTINAMAVALTPEGYDALLDPHGGLQDIEAGRVRVLHPRSFIDDPTRIFRAVKLAERLAFKIERGTLEFILQAVRDGVFATISTERATRELLLIMEEPNADVMLADLDRLGVLAGVAPGLAWPYEPGKMRPSEERGIAAEQRRDAYLAVLGAEYATDPAQAEATARWLHLPAPLTRLLRDAAQLAALWPQLGDAMVTPSGVYRLLHPLDGAAIEAYGLLGALSKDEVAWQRLQSYLKTGRYVKPAVGGNYLRELGVSPGPIYKQAIEALLHAILDSEARGREAEEQFLRGWLGERGLLGER